MDRENYYLLLDLDPSEKNPKAISAAIDAKQRQWSREKNQGATNKRRAADKYLGEIGDIRRVMGDELLRTKEAGEAQNILKKKKKENWSKVNDTISLLKGGGVYTPDQVKDLAKKLGGFLTEAEIEKQFVAAGLTTARKRCQKASSKPRARLEASQAHRHDTFIALVGKKDLYELLGGRPQFSPEQLVDLAEKLLKDIRARGKTDAASSAAQELAGLATKLFASEAEKAKYDYHLSVVNLKELEDHINRVAVDKILTEGNFEGLVRFARGKGVAEDLAREYVEEFADKRDIRIVWDSNKGESEPLVVCAACGTVAEIVGLGHCRECGAALYFDCPKCGAKVATGNDACGKCGFHSGDFLLVKRYLDQAEDHRISGDFGGAHAAIREARKIWSDWKDIDRVEAEVLKAAGERQRELDTLRALVDERRLVEARKVHGALRASGRDGGEWDGLEKTIRSGLDAAETNVQEARKADRAGDPEKALKLLQQAVIQCADHEGARKAMDAVPPPTPTALTLTLHGTGARLEWKAEESSLPFQFVAVRKQGGMPRSATDGDVVGCVADKMMDDGSMPPGIPWYYGVFSRRGDRFSTKGAVDGPVLSMEPLKALSAMSGDGMVALKWTLPVGCQEVQAFRAEGAPPTRPNQGNRLPASKTGLVDGGLENGKSYGYLLVPVYQDPRTRSAQKLGPPSRLQARPQPALEAIRDLRVERREEGFVFSWTPVRGGDSLLLIGQSSAFPKPGVVLARDEALALGRTIHSGNQGQCVVDVRESGLFSVVPLSMGGGGATVGKAVAVSTLTPLDGLKVHSQGARRLALTWTWPPGIEKARVRWQQGRFEEDVEGGRAASRDISLSDYQRTGHLLITPDTDGDLFISLFGQTKDKDFTPPAKKKFSAGGAVRISYKVVCIRGGLFSRGGGDTYLELKADSDIHLPEILGISKMGSQPISRMDGEQILRLGPVSLKGGDVKRFDIAERHCKRGTYLKLFPASPSSEHSFRLLQGSLQEVVLSKR